MKTTIISEQEKSNSDDLDFILSQTLVNTVIKTTNGHHSNGHYEEENKVVEQEETQGNNINKI